jgi:hypothetical protein
MVKASALYCNYHCFPSRIALFVHYPRGTLLQGATPGKSWVLPVKKHLKFVRQYPIYPGGQKKKKVLQWLEAN